MSVFTLSNVSHGIQKNNDVERIRQQPITNELIKILADSPKIKKLLIKSIESDKKINPDLKSNPVQTLEDWYTYLDWFLQAIPLKNLRKYYFSDTFEGLEQGLKYFYFRSTIR